LTSDLEDYLSVYNIVCNRECHPKDVASDRQQTRRGNGVVDGRDETDCRRRKTDGGRSVMPGVSRRSNQYLNWMWSVYRSSDSSRQCHGVTKHTVERLSGLAPGLRQLYHSVTDSYSHRESPNDPSHHTLHQLRARRLSKTHSTVRLHSTKSDGKVKSSRDHLQNRKSIT